MGINEVLKLGASYVAVKISNMNTIKFSVQNDLKSMKIERIPGAHVRVITDSAWGFAGSTILRSYRYKDVGTSGCKIGKGKRYNPKGTSETSPE